MTPAQITKFHTLKTMWIKARKAAGRPADDAALAAFKVREIGRDCSSKELKKAEFNAMIRAFEAEIYPADLNRQLKHQNQEEDQRASLLAQCDAACVEMANSGGEYQFGKRETRDAYVASIAMRVAKKWPEECDEAELGKVLGVLKARVKQLRGEVAKHAAGVLAAHRGEAPAAAAPAEAKEYMEPGVDF